MILLVAATPFEILPLTRWLQTHATALADGEFDLSGQRIRVCVTGIGLTATAFRLGCELTRQRPAWVINAGIAGALDPTMSLGQVVHVVTERFGDLGVEEADGYFTDFFEMGLLDRHEPPFVGGTLVNQAALEAHFLPQKNGITVQRVHGYEPSIADFRRKYPDAEVESMEGAAVFYACLVAGVPFFQIRSISNYVEARDRSKWQIDLAIDNLNQVLIELLPLLRPA
jgi:futalosine hydrolase